MKLLCIDAGHWWWMDGTSVDEELVLQLAGPPLAAKDPARAVVTGWREVGGDGDPGQVWVTVVVTAEIGRWVSRGAALVSDRREQR